MSEANFDRVAWIYDTLSFLVYGNSIKKAQKYFLNKIISNSEVLIPGGGTGFILEYLSEMNIPLNITYIDNSSKMIRSSKKRKINKELKVDFILGTESGDTDKKFDFIITNFFLDLFGEDRLKVVIGRLKNTLKADGKLIVTDFRYTGKGTVYQRTLSFLMHKFFKVFCNLESKELKDINSFLLKAGFALEEVRYFKRDFIFSGVYKLKNSTVASF